MANIQFESCTVSCHNEKMLLHIPFRTLCKLVGSKPQTWDHYLDAVMFGLRSRPHLTTEFSPFFLMFGIEARYPCEVPEHYDVRITNRPISSICNMSTNLSLTDPLSFFSLLRWMHQWRRPLPTVQYPVVWPSRRGSMQL